MTETNERRLFGRQRRANDNDGARQKRYVVKANAEEQTQLEARALVRGVTVPRLMVVSALNLHIETDTDRKEAIAELFALRRLLANVANNVNQIAKYANEERAFPARLTRSWGSTALLVPQISAAVERLAGT